MSELVCTKCNHKWLVKRLARYGKERQAVVKVFGVVKRCPNCGAVHEIKIETKEV